MNSAAVMNQSMMDPGPLRPAGAIQRADVTLVIANSRTSRKPSWRCKAGAGSATIHFLPQLNSDAAQTFLQEVRLSAQPDAEESFQSQMDSRHDQDTLIDADPLSQCQAGGP